jgi:hypothetical protein
MLADYEALLRGRLDEHDGAEESAAGDGHVLAFPGVRAALRCAVAVVGGGDGEVPRPGVLERVRHRLARREIRGRVHDVG